MRINLALFLSLFVMSTMIGQDNYTSSFCGQTFIFTEGGDIEEIFSYDTGNGGAGMNGMNGPIRRPVRLRSVTSAISKEIGVQKTAAINVDSNYVNLGMITTTSPDCGVDSGIEAGVIEFTFSWSNPTSTSEWASFANDDGQSIDLFFGDFIPEGTFECEASNDNFNAQNSDNSANSNFTGCMVTFQFLPSAASAPIPTLGEWGLILLSMGMLIIGLITLRIRRYNLSNNS